MPKSVSTATCNILALRRAVLPINDFTMCTDFPLFGLHRRPWLRRISHHEGERGTKRQGVWTPMVWCPMELGKVVVMTSQHPYCYRVHWCPGPDDEVQCPIVGKVVVVVLVRTSQYPSYSYSALVQASLKSYGVGGMKDAGSIHCH